MRTKEEIQKAHDILAGILLGEVPNPFGESLPDALKAATDVLCWVLQHEHNPTFASALVLIETFMTESDEEERGRVAYQSIKDKMQRLHRAAEKAEQRVRKETLH